MAGRHRLAVLPGLSSRSGTASAVGNEFVTTLATVDEGSNNRQLVPLSASNSKYPRHGWNGITSLKSAGDSEESLGSHIHNVVSRIGVLEEANKAILEEVYRLQSNARALDYTKKEAMREEKKVQRELMETIRASNDVIGQLTSRLRKAEEKLHQERDNVKKLSAHSKKLEQALFNTQREADSQRDAQNSLNGDLRHRVDDLARRWEKSDRTSESIVDEFHQLKNRVDLQAIEFSHLQNETKQRSKRTEDELKQTIQQARYQKDTNSMAEQNNLQLRSNKNHPDAVKMSSILDAKHRRLRRHLLESRMAESRDAISELRSRLSQSEGDARSQIQQLSLRLTDLQSSITDVSHQRQEEIQSMEKVRQEQHHTEANERIKLQNKIQIAVEEMSEKLLQKEVRLREEAVKKFIDVERLFQQEEASRNEFEKQLREDSEARWSMQQRLYVEELQAMKEMRRSDRTKLTSNLKKVDECLFMLDKKVSRDRKAIEKVLFAEITKREVQTNQVTTQIDGVQEQLRVAISSLQHALGGVQLQAAQDKEKLLAEVKSRLGEEEEKLARAVSDVDARLTAISMRITQQDETLDTKMNDFKLTMKDEHNQLLRSANEWRESTDKEMVAMRDVLGELPQEIRETQERVELLKTDVETSVTLESESRIKDIDALRKQMRQLSLQIEEFDTSSLEEKKRQAKMERDVITLQGSVSQMEQLFSEIKSNLGVRINSETKMRLEETSAIKRDLARLRVDVQPLLWQHNAMGRTFVKTPMSFLNEWGIYQCARWYDIKMRWLRLLDKSKRRNRNRTQKDPPRKTTPPAPDVDPDAIGGDLNQPRNLPEQADTSSVGRVSTIGERPPSEDNYFGDVTGDEGNDVRTASPQPAWYNRDNVVQGEADAELDGSGMAERNGEAGRIRGAEKDEDMSVPDGNTESESEENRKRSFHEKEIHGVTSTRNSEDEFASRDEYGFTSRENTQDSFGQEIQDEAAVSRQISGANISQNSRKRNTESSASPTGVSSNINASAKGRSLAQAKKSPIGTGSGHSYDMEGTR